MNDKNSLVFQCNEYPLSAPRDAFNAFAGDRDAPDGTPTSTQRMLAGLSYARQLSLTQTGPQITDHSFDFRQFGHGAPRPWFFAKIIEQVAMAHHIDCWLTIAHRDSSPARYFMAYNLDALINDLDHLEKRASLTGLKSLLERLELDAQDMEGLIRFGEPSYQRILVKAGRWYHLWVMCWKNGQRS